MKIITILPVILMFTFNVKGQNLPPLDTIYANETHNVALFFPQAIAKAITGSADFVFSYNREKAENYGLLQGAPGKESNLLVVGQNGAVFSFILKFSRELNALAYFVPLSKSIGAVSKSEEAVNKVVDSTAIKPEALDRYYRLSARLINQKRRIQNLSKTEQDITLRVGNIVFDQDELYFVIQIENRSSLAYDLNFLKFSIQTKAKGKRKSMQSLAVKPIYAFNVPERILKNQVIPLVYVLPKFSLDSDRRAELELSEKNGGRSPILKIAHRYINDPN